MTLDNILEEIKKADTILILSHENPDGDAIGSGLAMMWALKNMEKNVDLVIKEYPENFKFLPGTEFIKINQYSFLINFSKLYINIWFYFV